MAHRERHRSDRIGSLRAAVLGADDGIVSTASLAAGIYARRDLDPGLARTVARQLMAKGALAAHARDELGLTEELAARSLQAATASAATFAVGAGVPILTILFAPREGLATMIAVREFRQRHTQSVTDSVRPLRILFGQLPTVQTLEDLVFDTLHANKGTDRGRHALARSLQEYGPGRAVLVDRHGEILAGNKTVAEAKRLNIPLRVVQTDGDVLIAVQRTDLDLATDARARALAIADNRVGEFDLEWDVAMLQRLRGDGLDLSAFWTPDEFAALLGTGTGDDGAENAVVEPVAETDIVPGDLWLLGWHRLLCGDATSGSDVLRLLDGVTPVLMTTDPPYGVAYRFGVAASHGSPAADGGGARLGRPSRRMGRGLAVVPRDDRLCVARGLARGHRRAGPRDFGIHAPQPNYLGEAALRVESR